MAGFQNGMNALAYQHQILWMSLSSHIDHTTSILEQRHLLVKSNMHLHHITRKCGSHQLVRCSPPCSSFCLCCDWPISCCGSYIFKLKKFFHVCVFCGGFFFTMSWFFYLFSAYCCTCTNLNETTSLPNKQQMEMPTPFSFKLHNYRFPRINLLNVTKHTMAEAIFAMVFTQRFCSWWMPRN